MSNFTFSPLSKSSLKLDWLTCIKFARSDQNLVTGGRDGVLRLWETSTLALEMQLPVHTAHVSAVAALGRAGDRIVSSSIDGSICFWDVSQCSLVRNFAEGNTPGCCLASLPDDSAVLSGHEDGSVAIWNIHNGTIRSSFHGHFAAIFGVDVSHATGQIATASGDSTVAIWDLSTFKKLGILNGHTGPVKTVCFSHDGARIFSGSRDETIRVWDARTFSEIEVLGAHKDAVTSVVITDDGVAISTGLDKAILVWDICSYKLLGEICHLDDVCACLTVNDDWTILACASLDGFIRTWRRNTAINVSAAADAL